MLHSFNAWFTTRPGGGRVLLALILFLLMFGVFGWVLDPAFQAVTDGILPYDMSPDKSPAVMYGQLAHYTERSRTLYKWFFLLDLVYPPTLALVFATLWAWLAGRSARPFMRRWIDRGVLALPFVAAFLDWTENVGFLTVILSYPADHRGIALGAAIVNYVKLGLLSLCMLITVTYAIGALVGAKAPPTAAPAGRG